jgi:hypothetical protein
MNEWREESLPMRLATLILGLVLGVVVGAQSCVVYMGGALDGQAALRDEGATGLFLAACLVVGAAFVWRYPMVAAVAFAVAWLSGIRSAHTVYTDLPLWGWASLALLLLAGGAERELTHRAAPPSPPPAAAPPPASTLPD